MSLCHGRLGGGGPAGRAPQQGHQRSHSPVRASYARTASRREPTSPQAPQTWDDDAASAVEVQHARGAEGSRMRRIEELPIAPGRERAVHVSYTPQRLQTGADGTPVSYTHLTLPTKA